MIWGSPYLVERLPRSKKQLLKNFLKRKDDENLTHDLSNTRDEKAAEKPCYILLGVVILILLQPTALSIILKCCKAFQL